jgi:hypothetical protein
MALTIDMAEPASKTMMGPPKKIAATVFHV